MMPHFRFAAAAAFAVLAFGSARANYDRADFDPTVRPQDDFYHYVNGTWLKTHPIPAAYSSYGAFDEVNDHNEAVLHRILERVENPANRAAEGPLTRVEQQVGDFYASGLDENAVNAAGLTPLQPGLAVLDAMRSPADLQGAIAQLHLLGIPVGFGFGSEQDPRNSAMVIGGCGQSGLGLPERDYYLKSDAKSVEIRGQYVEHVAKMLVLAGDPADRAQQEAAAILQLETALAQASKSNVDLRDPVANYHLIPVADLGKITPTFDWIRYFHTIGLEPPAAIDLGQPEFMTALDGLLTSTPLADWRAYLRWHLLHSLAPYLSKAFVDENWNFFAHTLTGATDHRERWKRVLGTVDDSIGEDLGQLYVADAFPPQAKVRMLALVENLRETLRDKLEHLAWMDAATRKQALAKIDALHVKIGYTDKWIDYGSLKIDRTSYAGNVLRARQFNNARDLHKIGRPVDRTEWSMTPSTVNAYYDPPMNEIVFPAGILQSPFFVENADDASNYGAIGAIIGHEMTHGFDDQGRQYDPHGNLTDWWTPASAQRFKERAAAIVKQFNGYVAVDNLHINGELTQGENIADLGGLKIAYAALHRELAKKPGAEKRLIDGFTVDQRFFLSFATQYRENQRTEDARLQISTDPHSPAQFRVNGPLSNLPEFARAFDVKEGQAMRRPKADQVNIW
jgi:predicted metalloendopeptidase